VVQAELGGNVALDNVEHARQALAKSDLAGALFHVSSALATEPQNREWRAILDDAIRKAPDPMVFVRKDEAKADYITAATRGYVHAFKNEWVDAFATVADVCAARPEAPFMPWATERGAVPRRRELRGGVDPTGAPTAPLGPCRPGVGPRPQAEATPSPGASRHPLPRGAGEGFLTFDLERRHSAQARRARRRRVTTAPRSRAAADRGAVPVESQPQPAPPS